MDSQVSLIRIQWMFSLIFQQNRCFRRNGRLGCTPKSLLKDSTQQAEGSWVDCVSHSRRTGAGIG